MMKNRKLVKGIALAAVITALAAGGTAAYLTDFETATNSFTVGKVDIDLDEPNWKPEDNTDLVPTQVIRKDPYVSNKGVNEAFVYLKCDHGSQGWHQECACKNRAVQLYQKQGLDTAGADRSGAEYGLYLCI